MKPIMGWTLFGLALGLCCISLSFGCAGGTSTNDARKGDIGVLELRLTGSGVSGTTYRLRGAQFNVTGTSELAFSSEDSLSQASAQMDLPAGEYAVVMSGEWYLERALPVGYEKVNASLVSANPVSFTIAAETITKVLYRFRTEAEVVNLGEGNLELHIDVEEADAGVSQPCEDILFDNWNIAACTRPTNASVFGLPVASRVEAISIWVNTAIAGSELSFSLSGPAGVVTSGPMNTVTGCDPYQNNWCGLLANISRVLAPGTYTLTSSAASTCSNAGSSYVGFAKVVGCVEQ